MDIRKGWHGSDSERKRRKQSKIRASGTTTISDQDKPVL